VETKSRRRKRSGRCVRDGDEEEEEEEVKKENEVPLQSVVCLSVTH